MYREKPFHNAGSKAWRNAKKCAGLGDFRFHDLRHVFATRHIERGTSLFELQELAGRKKRTQYVNMRT